MKIERNHAYFSSEFPKLRIKMNYSTPSKAGIQLIDNSGFPVKPGMTDFGDATIIRHPMAGEGKG